MTETGPNVRRRTVISGAITGLVSLAGCIGANAGSESNHNSSTSQSTTATQSPTGKGTDDSPIQFQELSEAAQTEVRTAVEQGRYSTCESLALRDEIDLTANPVIVYEETKYEPVIRVGSGNDEDCGTKYVLTMEPVAPTIEATAERNVVFFDKLPSEAQTEVKTAIQQGMYSECGPLALEKAIDLETDPLINYQGDLYKPEIMIGGAGKQENDCAKHILQIDAVDGSTSTAPDDVVAFESLSKAAQKEVKAAIQQDRYTSCESLALTAEIDTDSPPWIEYKYTYYHPVVDTATASADASCDSVHTLRMRPR